MRARAPQPPAPAGAYCGVAGNRTATHPIPWLHPCVATLFTDGPYP